MPHTSQTPVRLYLLAKAGSLPRSQCASQARERSCICHTGWITTCLLLQTLKLLPEELDAVGVARFMRNCPGLSKQTIGELLGDNDDFFLEVLHEFTQTFDFAGGLQRWLELLALFVRSESAARGHTVRLTPWGRPCVMQRLDMPSSALLWGRFCLLCYAPPAPAWHAGAGYAAQKPCCLQATAKCLLSSQHLHQPAVSCLAALSFDAALRMYLESFRLPGESQKINRVMESFGQRYHAQCPELFKNPDAVYILGYSTIMLNTDQHNNQVRRHLHGTCWPAQS